MKLNSRITSLAGTVLTAVVLSTGTARADVVLDWNAIMVSTVATQQPFAQARFAAIMQLAVFEAVNTITGDYKTYRVTGTATSGASPEAAAIAAAHTVLKNYFPGNAVALDAARVSSLAGIADGPAKTSGITTGELAAAAVIAMRNNDGAAPPEFYLPGLQNPGEWQS
ncbi:MAG: superfamily protein, partial [Candidatus Solibacter sp.]|nr:superfamily protein [Candidatus Solibacter sp.]